MISWAEPSEERLLAILASQRDAPFSFAEVGATRGAAPAGYAADAYGTTLGRGEDAFERARAAVRRWETHRLPWIRIVPANARLAEGEVVGVLARTAGLWSFHVCRVVYLVDEEDAGGRRFGYAYGTLDHHAERGEERFCVTWDRATGEVRYEIRAFSRPGHWAALVAYPFGRWMQRRFGRGSLEALAHAVRVTARPA